MYAIRSYYDFYYTPTLLTTNSLIFKKEEMKDWWHKGYQYAQQKDVDTQEIQGEDIG